MVRAKYMLVFVSVLVFSTICHSWEMELEKDTYTVYMDEKVTVHFNLTGGTTESPVYLELMSDDPHVIKLSFNGSDPSEQINLNLFNVTKGRISGSFTANGIFLGRTRIIATLTVNQKDGKSEELPPIEMIVTRHPRTIDRIFTGSVAVLVSLIYINFGCAVDWGSIRPLLRRPIGPAIGFLGQFLVMPALSYAVGLLIFPDRPDMRLGMLFTGVSPAGGASNIWTVVLDGNVNLSVTMTTISTLAALGMMPLWLFTLGPSVFAEAKIAVPYGHVASLAAALVVPLLLGWLAQIYLPKMAVVMAKILKGFSGLLIIFIVVFAIATNLYLFQLATWKIVVAGLLLPWCGFALGAVLAAVARLPSRDVLAVTIETGMQNTGIAIFLLRFSLPQPQADLTTVVPVAIAVMTPVPLALLYLYRRFCRRNGKESFDIETSQLDVGR